MPSDDAIDPNCRRLRPLNSYCDRLPRDLGGRRLNPSTLWRFRLRGVCGIRLPAVSLGGRWLTCDADVYAWMQRVAQARNRESDPCAAPANVGTAAESRRTKETLKRAGIVASPEGTA